MIIFIIQVITQKSFTKCSNTKQKQSNYQKIKSLYLKLTLYKTLTINEKIS